MTETNLKKAETVMGPVDYLMVRFPGNKFSGKIAPELLRLEKEGIVRVIDLVFLIKDEKGNLGTIEPKNLEGEAGAAFRELTKNTSEWFTEPDIEVIAGTLPKNSSAGLLLFENLWAIRFKKALLEADAELIDMGRIPPEAIVKAEKAMKSQGGA
ncbi:MAG TPA: DUF6325 family protein [Methanoregulaceae archaeon]|nr:DUF6325 family protein [Methanoregulaceae archaeon]